MRAWFNKQNFQNIGIEEETRAFVDYWLSEGKKKHDWIATWRNGMRRQEGWKANDKKSEDSWKTNFLK